MKKEIPNSTIFIAIICSPFIILYTIGVLLCWLMAFANHIRKNLFN